ncbi:hypothetical protein LINPERHAP2_LOCUS16851, partial [Linum perenne]
AFASFGVTDPKTKSLVGVGSKVGRSSYLKSLPFGLPREATARTDPRKSLNFVRNFDCFSARLALVNKWNLWNSRL